MKVMKFTSASLFAAAMMLATASAATIAYWEFDNGDHLSAAVGGSKYNLTTIDTALPTDTINLVDPIPNPDATVGFIGDATNNAGRVSIAGNGTAGNYLRAGTDSADAMKVNGNAWTFEGWASTTGAGVLNRLIVVGNSGIQFQISAGNQFNLFLNDGSSSETAFSGGVGDFTLTVGTAYHFAVTHNGSGLFELFVDGASVGTHTTSLSLSAIDTRIDTHATDALELLRANGVAGYADEFRISDQVLAPSAFLIPEPSSALFLGLGSMVVMVLRRRR